MRFLLACELSPSSPFGLPEQDTLVLPAPGGEFVGPAVHSRAGVAFGSGSLPIYRTLETRLDTEQQVDTIHLRIVDNGLEIRFDAPERSAALAAGLAIVERFLQRLALEQGQRFTARALYLEDDSGELLPLPIMLWRGKVTVFDIAKLTRDVQGASATLDVEDAKLAKALEYFEHALFLQSATPRIDGFAYSLRTTGHLVSGACLFLWKALSVIVGDPSIDRDYQSRYRAIGLEYEFFAGTLEKIRRLRNEEDVAHYRVDLGGIEAVRQELASATQAVQLVVKAYVKTIRAQADQKAT